MAGEHDEDALSALNRDLLNLRNAHRDSYARAKRDIVAWLRWKAVEPGVHPVSLSSAAQMIALGASDGFADRNGTEEEKEQVR